jgi:hypothetical protein
MVVFLLPMINALRLKECHMISQKMRGLGNSALHCVAIVRHYKVSVGSVVELSAALPPNALSIFLAAP